MKQGELLQTVFETTKRIEDRITRLETGLSDRFDRLEERTTTLERLHENLTGKLTVVWFIATATITIAIDYFKGIFKKT